MTPTLNQLLRHFTLLFTVLITHCGTAHARCDPSEGSTFPQCASMARQGNAIGQLALGVMYLLGTGVAPSSVQAAYWYRKAAEQGNANAQNLLGLLYFEGNGVEGDPVQAAFWYRKAAEQGNANAQNNLGKLYFQGKGVEEDPIQAAFWFQKAAEQGNANAQTDLGMLYFEGKGVEGDPVQAVYWFRKAAEQGNYIAQFNLGARYMNGEGVERNPAQALYWLRMAAEGGYPMAIDSLGVWLIGVGLPLDIEEGLQWVRKGASLNQPGSIATLGLLHGAGLGVEKDMLKAREYLEQAAAMWKTEGAVCPQRTDDRVSCTNAIRYLALMWQQGWGGAVDIARAEELFAAMPSGSEFDVSKPSRLGFLSGWASASLPAEEEQVCLSAAEHADITFKASTAAKPDRYFDAVIFLDKDMSFEARDHRAWQQTSDILLQCGIQLRKLRIFPDKNCQPAISPQNRAGSAVPIYYKKNTGGRLIAGSASSSGQQINFYTSQKNGDTPAIAHELGHLFGDFAHPANLEPNIMQYGVLMTDTFSPAQCEAMRRSPLLARLPALPTKRSDTSPIRPAAWARDVRSQEDIYKQLRPKNKLAALFYEFRPHLTSRDLRTTSFLKSDNALSSIDTAMLGAKYDVTRNQLLRMYEIAHNWPIEAGWPTERTIFDLSGKPDLFWLPGLQTRNTQEELEAYRRDYRNWCSTQSDIVGISTINSSSTWCNSRSADKTHKRSLRPGDEFIINLELSSRVGVFSKGNEVWLHGGDLFYVTTTLKGREVVFVTPNAFGLWDGESLDEVRKNTWYDRDWENPKLNPVEEIHSDVRPTSSLRAGNFGAPTPATLTGAKTVTPREVWQTIVAGYGSSKRVQKPLILAAMDDTPCLPTAHDMAFAAKGGSYDDEVQRKLQSKMLELGAKKDQPLVVYCHHKSCWLSYNLGLRLVALGYTNVQWMRGGWNAWQESGLPMWTIESVQTP